MRLCLVCAKTLHSHFCVWFVQRHCTHISVSGLCKDTALIFLCLVCAKTLHSYFCVWFVQRHCTHISVSGLCKDTALIFLCLICAKTLHSYFFVVLLYRCPLPFPLMFAPNHSTVSLSPMVNFIILRHSTV